MLKKIFIFLFLFILSYPVNLFAQEAMPDEVVPTETIFEARVIKILEEKEIAREDGDKATQQDLLLKGLEGEDKNKEIEINGISEIDFVSVNHYKVGDRVLVQKTETPDGQSNYFIIDIVRRNPIYLLTFIFAVVTIIIGGSKGIKALISLIATFLIIVYFILPKILNGANPFLISVIGSLTILTIIIYLTEGWHKKSHLAIISVTFSLVLIVILSSVFTAMTRLTGFAQEESVFLIGVGQKAIDFKGLLLAGILIGAVGVLDDIIVGQLEAVKQIKEANPNLKPMQVFKMAYRVGNTHLGAIVNTLFLTYAGASLPLLLLFTLKQEPYLTFNQIINNEVVATEIVRTLVGSIGVAMSMPISTYFGAFWLKADISAPKKK